MKPLLVYAIGNPGREDDGLGFEFVKKLGEGEGHEIAHTYQLNIEDAEYFSKFERVLLVDAAKNLEKDFSHYEIKPASGTSFTTHGLPPECVLAMTKKLYNKIPKTEILAIKGEGFELKEGLTVMGEKALEKAWEYFQRGII